MRKVYEAHCLGCDWRGDVRGFHERERIFLDESSCPRCGGEIEVETEVQPD